MKIIRFLDASDEVCWGHDYHDGQVIPLPEGLFGSPGETATPVPVKKVLAPLLPPAIFGIGLNYRAHAEETGREIPTRPVVFMKNPAAIQNPDDPVIIPRDCMRSPQVDYEVELAVVIGRAAKNVTLDSALDHVLGYTVGNDVSARRWQKKGGGGQWVRGKSFDTFCPLGPVLVTADEIPDPQGLVLKTTLNGREMQRSNTGDMIFSVAELITELSQDMTLLPGTVIMTGTPSGVGYPRKPPVFLMPGDSVTVTVEKIGSLTNPVVGPH